MKYRIEHDTMGEVQVPAERHWGAQTQRSKDNFKIGGQRQPQEIITAFAYLKEACAQANFEDGLLSKEQADVIAQACQEIRAGKWDEEFPLVVWQTGSGTQTNMNVNEVISHIAADHGVTVHPNDHANRSQSSNDTYPSALHIAAVLAVSQKVLPAAQRLEKSFKGLEEAYPEIIKIGRTHLQDATPIRFAQEVSGWREMVAAPCRMLESSLTELRRLAIGGTAVGTGLNAPQGFDTAVAAAIAQRTGLPFRTAADKFHALTAKDALVFSHGALKALAADLMKIANDVRWLASGPRCGLGEITIPENEPGSSIMPGKVNPTQCEAMTMVAVQVMGNDAAIGFAASQGNFELNVFMPVLAHEYLQSVRLLADAMVSFTDRCLVGLKADRAKMAENLERSLMTVTALTPLVGYENGAKIAKLAHKEDISLREATLRLGLMTAEAFDAAFHPEEMA